MYVVVKLFMSLETFIRITFHFFLQNCRGLLSSTMYIRLPHRARWRINTNSRIYRHPVPILRNVIIRTVLLCELWLQTTLKGINKKDKQTTCKPSHYATLTQKVQLEESGLQGREFLHFGDLEGRAYL